MSKCVCGERTDNMTVAQKRQHALLHGYILDDSETENLFMDLDAASTVESQKAESNLDANGVDTA